MAESSEVVSARPGLRGNNALTWATRSTSALAALTAALVIAAYAAYSIARGSAVGFGDVPAALMGALPFAGLAALAYRASRHATAIATSGKARAELTSTRELVGVSLAPLFLGFFFASLGLGFTSVSDLSGFTPLVVHLAQAAVLLSVPVVLGTIVIAIVARVPVPAP